jgi:hypothetical protein
LSDSLWIKETKRKQRIFTVVFLVGILVFAAGEIYFWMNDIQKESSNIWIDVHLAISFIFIIVGGLGCVYYRELWDKDFELHCSYGENDEVKLFRKKK